VGVLRTGLTQIDRQKTTQRWRQLAGDWGRCKFHMIKIISLMPNSGRQCHFVLKDTYETRCLGLCVFVPLFVRFRFTSRTSLHPGQLHLKNID
jgi:hypothetical protein